jgi:hypothetical protein
VGLLLTSTTGHLPSKSDSAMSRRIRCQLLRALPPPLIDDLAPPPSASPSPMTSSPAIIERYTSRDPISFFQLFNLTGVRAMLTPAVMFMLLLNHASIQVMLNLVLEFVMIYILVLI